MNSPSAASAGDTELEGMVVGAFRQSCCPICLERYTPDNPAILFKCEHSFHFQCIDDWWQRSNRCPVCDRKMKRSHGRDPSTAPPAPAKEGSESSDDIVPIVPRLHPREQTIEAPEEEVGEVMADDEVLQFFSSEELARLSRHVGRPGRVEVLRQLLTRRAAMEGRLNPMQRSLERVRMQREVDGPAEPATPTVEPQSLPAPSNSMPQTQHSAPHERVRLTVVTHSDDEDEHAPSSSSSCCCCHALGLVKSGWDYVWAGGGWDRHAQNRGGRRPFSLRSLLGLRHPIGVEVPPSPNTPSPSPNRGGSSPISPHSPRRAQFPTPRKIL